MGTKNDPGKFDCYAAAAPDEPFFMVLGRDPTAAFLVRMWRYLRDRLDNAGILPTEPEKLAEAGSTALALSTYCTQNFDKGAALEFTSTLETRVRQVLDDWPRLPPSELDDRLEPDPVLVRLQSDVEDLQLAARSVLRKLSQDRMVVHDLLPLREALRMTGAPFEDEDEPTESVR